MREKYYELCKIFVDLMKGFDSVDIDSLWTFTKIIGIPDKMLWFVIFLSHYGSLRYLGC